MTHIFLGFQDSCSPSIMSISNLHDWALLILIVVISIVLYLGVFIWMVRIPYSKFLESEFLEAMWTLIPIVVLFILSLVSLRSLYLLEEVSNPDLTVNITGHQWYWSYECDAFLSQEFDSYIVPTAELGLEGSRLLEVDNALSLPVGVECRLIVLSEDVLHSWALPSLGLNIDAVPGRLNQIVVSILRSGILYGQCSEICGASHAFMPIKVECFAYRE